MTIAQQFLVVLSLATATLAAIRPIQSFKDQAKTLKVDLEASRSESFRFDTPNDYETTRHRRSSDVPVATRATFNDNNFVIVVTYSRSGSQVIYAMTYDNFDAPSSTNLYRSDNYGRSFTNINSALGSNVLLTPGFILRPDNDKVVIILHDSDPAFFISTDEGATFTRRSLTTNDGGTINPRSLLFHPTRDSWFLAHDPTRSRLYLSKDLGVSPLTFISDNVVSVIDYQWGVAPYDADDVFYYNVDDVNDSGFLHYFYKYASGSGAEFDPSLGTNNDFLIIDRYIFVHKTVDDEATLWMSYNRKPFMQALIPSNVAHQNYIVADIKGLQAFVMVQHVNGVLNLYTSDETGVYFSLSLADISDIAFVESEHITTYIANQFNGSAVRTLISFDAGGNWDSIRSPEYDSEDSPLDCVLPFCSLHLDIPSVYSQESAPGIIIAHGATGAVFNENDLDLYMSRDGGVTWQEALKSTWGVSVLDHGGLLVAAQDVNTFLSDPSSTSMIFYSCDEGSTWANFTFSEFPTVVFGVATEPGETTTVVSLFGSDNFNTLEWVVIAIDFTNIFDRVCEASDYYEWMPYDVHNDRGCVLGERVTIERRVPDSCCLNQHEYERIIDTEVCPCTVQDFECDYGYRPADGLGGYCVIDSAVTLPDPCANSAETYSRSQGYRKIGGDVCTDGVESLFDPITLSCGPTIASKVTSASSSDIAAVVLAVLLVIAVAIIIGFVVFMVIKMCRKMSAKADMSPVRFTSGGDTASTISTVDDIKPLVY